MIIFKYLLLNEKFLISLFILFFSLFFFKNNKILFLVFYTSFIYLFFLFIIYLSSSLDLDWYLNSASRVIKPIALFFSIFSIYNKHNQNKNIYSEDNYIRPENNVKCENDFDDFNDTNCGSVKLFS